MNKFKKSNIGNFLLTISGLKKRLKKIYSDDIIQYFFKQYTITGKHYLVSELNEINYVFQSYLKNARSHQRDFIIYCFSTLCIKLTMSKAFNIDDIFNNLETSNDIYYNTICYNNVILIIIYLKNVETPIYYIEMNDN